MLLTPVILLSLSCGAFVFGIVLAWWGRRGKPIDAHPICRKCRFDLVGRPQGSDRCPECGTDLHWTNAIAVGNRKPRQSGMVVGGCFVLLSVCAFGTWGWKQFSQLKETDKPIWLVLHDSRSSNANLRSSALKLLARRQHEGDLSESQSDAYIDRLSEILQSNDVQAQRNALELLSDAGSASQRAIPAIVTIFRTADPPPPSRFRSRRLTRGEMAAELLQNLEAPGQEAALREVKAGSPQVLKNWLVNAYLDFEVTDEKVAQLLLNALNSEDEELARSAHLALDHCSTAFPCGPAVAGLHDPHPQTRQVCLKLLGKLDKRPPFDVLLPLLHDSDADVCSTAEEALMNCHQWTDDPRSEQLLQKMLADPNDKHRLQAAESLGFYKTQESARGLAQALKDSNQSVSTAASYSLGRIGSEVAVDAIIDILDDLPPDRRAFAEAFADQLAGGDFKKTSYWQRHEAAKHLH